MHKAFKTAIIFLLEKEKMPPPAPNQTFWFKVASKYPKKFLTF
jgi:hypothetical protein